MRIYIKVTIVFFALFFGVVALIEFLPSKHKGQHFKLIDRVEENGLTAHIDLNTFFLEYDKYSKEAKATLTERVVSGQVKQQLLKSGLKLEETYLTYGLLSNQMSSFYAEIHDTSLFEVAFINLSKYFELTPSEAYPFFYSASNANLSIEKHPEYIKVNWGKGAALEEPKEIKQPSSLFKSLLKSSGTGVINTTGTAHLDPNDYASFGYEYKNNFSFTVNWNVKNGHPLKTLQKTIPIYSSIKNNVQAFSNLDIKNIEQNINPYLMERGRDFISKLPLAAQELLVLWDGQASLQLGGKTTKETIQYITAFDDDFNPIESKTVKTDSIPDLGFYWGTKHPIASFDALIRIPNVKMQKEKLQLALFPPLTIKQEEKALKAAATDIPFEQEKSKYIIFINSENERVKGQLTVRKISNDVIQLHLILKDLNVPKKLNISSFW